MGGLLWVTPAVQLIGISPTHAQSASGGGGTTPTTTPGGGGGDLKGISFIAFRFTCSDGTFFAKAENITSTSFDCDGPNRGQNCGVDQSGADDGCGRFTLSGHVFDTEGELVAVTVNLTCADAAFVAGSSKCGQQPCVSASISGSSATFFGCP